MKRKDFIKKTALGVAGGVTLTSLTKTTEAAASAASKEEIIGFNHIPNTSSKVMDNIVLHRAHTRGHANHGWLDTNHTFSFANYHNPERMHFGVLRVLNDDHVEAGMGFGTHPHQNMEIISIPLEGDLEHRDSMGNKGVIKQGDVQVMSAGTGIQHSEYNKNADRPVKFLQIWIFPKHKNVVPRYDQMSFDWEAKPNALHQILSPNADDDGVWIHQDAWFHMAYLEQGKDLNYQLKKKGNGVYIFIIEGAINASDISLQRRDGMGIWNHDEVKLTAISTSKVLVMEVPMQIS
jgi:redox-sensitive bicupin YhaK (pirin superfamily)